ncbi:MAG: DNA-directed DNA polymerase I, partial [Candidatus Helarchaeales archaeon]
RTIERYPVVVTFNGDNFDFAYLYQRAINLGISKNDIPITKARDITQLKTGVHLDLYKFFHNNAIKVSAFGKSYQRDSLDEISQQLLKRAKIEHPTKEIYEMSYKELAYYCLTDSELTLELTCFNNNLVMNLIILLMRISKLSMEDLTRLGVNAWIRNLFYWEHRRRNYIIPNPDYILMKKGEATSTAVIKGKKYQGATVIEPKPGIYFNVAVLDFASLYPSIIKTYNLSYETVNCVHEECRSNIMPGTNYWVCTRKIGIMALLIGILKELRVRWFKPLSKDKKLSEEERRYFHVVQMTLKVIVNASYGVFGFENFPLYCPPVADSTTAGGRYAIQETKKKAESMGITVLYGDTDSVFLLNPSKEQMEELVRWSNENLNMDLEVEKIFRYVALSHRKKNYFGVYQDGSVDVKGLSGKKSNTPPYIQKAFYKMLQILSEVKTESDLESAREKIKKLLQVILKKLKTNKIPKEELAFQVLMNKKIESYEKTTPQHVKAAKMLEEKGIKVEPGEFIQFLKTKDPEGVCPLQLAKVEDIDYKKYKETVESVFEQVLDALDIDFKELTGSKSLSHFM